MKHLVVFAAAMAFSASAAARSIEVCPELPGYSNLAWSYQEGPDFDVCYAREPGSEATAFGAYLGNHPSFHSDGAVRSGKGRVAGRRVAWYHLDATEGEQPWGRQTLLMLDRKNGYVAHIWVMADTEQQLQDRLSVLERMVIR